MSLAGSYNGLTFGPGTKVHVSAETGLDDLPAVRSADAPRAADHGAWRGFDYLDERTIQLELGIAGNDFNDYLAQLSAVLSAFVPSSSTELPLYVHGSTRLVKARVRKLLAPYDAGQLQRTGVVTVQLVASDPRIYDAAQQNLAVGLPTASGGMTFNATFNLGFGSAGTGGSIQVTNFGNYPTRPVLVIAGPCDTPIVQNITTGQSLQFNVTLAAGDTLTVDLDARSILLLTAGSIIPASRRNALAAGSSWFELAPGTTTLNFRANTYQAASSLAIQFRSAWMGRGGVL